ncbi:hypothetical protein [Leeuwenhoekiella marinoflava]|uniref:hypothetical protein n=1 Tax=Leeuwenhoekiella marinoflava TaxID=988 RepID=UPI003001E71E
MSRFKLVLSIFMLSLFVACGNDDAITNNGSNLRVAVNDTLIISQRDTAPVEGRRQVTVQPKNGKILLETFSIKYIPREGFTGTDYVEITNEASPGNNDYYITSVDKYTINVR